MAQPTGSTSIEYKTVVEPTQEVTSEDSNGSDSFLLPQENTKKEAQILVSPTPKPTFAPAKPIELNFFNVRVFGFVIGVVFLVIYIQGLRKK